MCYMPPSQGVLGKQAYRVQFSQIYMSFFAKIQMKIEFCTLSEEKVGIGKSDVAVMLRIQESFALS